MIVEEPPYDLVFVFADADAKLLLEQLVERAQINGRMAQIRWRSIRDSRRDSFRADPISAISAFRQFGDCRFVFSWDHEGSGQENQDRADSESEVIERLRRSGIIAERCLAVAFFPEVEALLVPAWDRVKEVVAGIRDQLPPTDDEIFTRVRRILKRNRMVVPDDFNVVLHDRPKEALEALVDVLELRWSPSIFQNIGRTVSLNRILAHSDAERIFRALTTWFPPEG